MYFKEMEQYEFLVTTPRALDLVPACVNLSSLVQFPKRQLSEWLQRKSKDMRQEGYRSWLTHLKPPSLYFLRENYSISL